MPKQTLKKDRFYKKGQCKHLDPDETNLERGKKPYENGRRMCLLTGYTCFGYENCEDYEEEE